jgi:hypothetical protein
MLKACVRTVCSLVFLGGQLALAAEEVATSPPAPQLVVEQPVVDVGSVSRGEKVHAEFVVENRGTADLEIRDVRPSCGCTVASFDQKIPPGGKGKVVAGIDTSDFQGAISKTVTVLSNDPKNPQLELTVKVKVITHIIAKPGRARFVYVQTLEPGTITQTLWAPDFPEEFRVLEARSPYPFLKASVREAKENEKDPDGVGRQWKVDLTIQPDAEVGPLREFLVIVTNHPKQKEVRIPISGFVRPLMHATPEEIELGEFEVSSETPLETEVVLVNFGNDPIEVTEVESDRKGVSAEALATELGRRFKIVVKVLPEVGKGEIRGVLKVKTSSPKKPVYEIPYHGKAL